MAQFIEMADGTLVKYGNIFYETCSGKISEKINELGTHYASDWKHTRFANKEQAHEYLIRNHPIEPMLVENSIRHHMVDRDGKELISEDTVKKIMESIYRHILR